MLSSGWTGKSRNVSVFTSNLASPAWNIMASHQLPSGSGSSASAPVGKPGLSTGYANSFSPPFRRSNRPTLFTTKFEYQTNLLDTTQTHTSELDLCLKNIVRLLLEEKK